MLNNPTHTVVSKTTTNRVGFYSAILMTVITIVTFAIAMAAIPISAYLARTALKDVSSIRTWIPYRSFQKIIYGCFARSYSSWCMWHS